MRAKLIENIDFERGLKPKDAMNIGGMDKIKNFSMEHVENENIQDKNDAEFGSLKKYLKKTFKNISFKDIYCLGSYGWGDTSQLVNEDKFEEILYDFIEVYDYNLEDIHRVEWDGNDKENYTIYKNKDSILLNAEVATYGQYSYIGEQLFGDLQAIMNFINFIREL